MQGDEVRLDNYLGGQRVQDTRSERGRIPDSYDPGGILDLPEVSSGTQNPGNQRPRDQNPSAQGFSTQGSSAQGFGTRGFVTGQPAVYTPEASGKQPRKHLEASAEAPGARWTYVVKKGDTLERIARHQLGDHRRWTEIQALNGNLDPRKVRLGQKLTMPARRAARGATPRAQQPATTKPREASYKKTTPAPQKNQGGEYYVVQSGDVLGTISLKTLGTSKRWREILDLNPKVDPRRLLVGTKLRLPKRGAGTPAPVGPQLGGPQVAKNDVRPTPASVRKSGKKGFVVR